MEITLNAFEFHGLSNNTLYEMLKLRSEVFVVEQTCVYQDMDNKDQEALHILGYVNKELITYARIIEESNHVSIGRVITKQSYRGNLLGNKTMNFCLKECNNRWPNKAIQLSSQKHLVKFYERLGFKSHGKPYLEDGIPHQLMRLAVT